MRYPHDWTCRNCFSLVRESRDCNSCGYPKSWTCKRCSELNINSKICEECGYPGEKKEKQEAPVIVEERNRIASAFLDMKDRVLGISERISGKYIIISLITLLLIIVFSLRSPYVNIGPRIENVSVNLTVVGTSSFISLFASDEQSLVSSVSGVISSPSGKNIELAFRETNGSWVSENEVDFNEAGEWIFRILASDSEGVSSTKRVRIFFRNPCSSSNECEINEICVNSGCNVLECEYCEFVQNHSCTPYECCKTSECGGDSICENNTCKKLNCGECAYALGHECFNYECCSGSDCGSNESCEDNICELLSCDETQIIVNNTCITAQCIDNADCGFFEECSSNKCAMLSCGFCEYVKSHECVSYDCCNDNMCSEGFVCNTFHKCVGE